MTNYAGIEQHMIPWDIVIGGVNTYRFVVITTSGEIGVSA